MHDDPSISELLHGVIDFLATVAGPQLTGHAQFHARVSANALALIDRDISDRAGNEAHAILAYRALLQTDQNKLASLETLVCDKIRSGELDINSPNLLTTLRQICRNQVVVDQPSYSGLKL